MKIVLGLIIAQIFLGLKAQRGKYTVKFNVLNLNDIPQGNVYESYNEERAALSQNGLYILHHVIPDIFDRETKFIIAEGAPTIEWNLSKQIIPSFKVLEGFAC